MTPAPFEELSVHFQDLKPSEIYHLVTSMVVPRPIAVVGTIDENGIDNLAPFSYFNAVSSDPPCLMFSIGHNRDGSKKDTLRNIEKNKEFVIHIATADQVQWVEAMGEPLPYGESERAKLGLTLTPSQWVQCPRVKEFKISFECVLEKTLEIGSNTVVFGRVLGAHFDESLKIPNKMIIDSQELNPLARMARGYGKTCHL